MSFPSSSSFAFRPRFDWRLRTRTLPLGERTLVMQIVNLTPDSFSGDGHMGEAAAIDAAVKALDEGADILDLGAESTRPNATALSADEEQKRLMPVLQGILRLRPTAVLSIDTYHADTAKAALDAGAEIVNDVSGLLWDERMTAVVGEARCGLVLMHTRGRSQEWGSLPPLGAEEVLPVVRGGLLERMDAALEAGIAVEHIVLDPGFGFGKMGAENFALLARFAELAKLHRPLLAGLSRKRFLGEALPAAERVNATTAAHVAAILGGAHVVRAHDLRAAQEAVHVADAVLAGGLAG